MMESETSTSMIENLPHDLIHHIMKSVPYKDAVKFSVLSKTLHSTWLSFPVLDFDYTLFSGQPYNFLSSILETLHHRCPHRINKPLQRLRVKYAYNYRESFPFHTVFEFLLNIAIKNNAKEIIFDIYTKTLVVVRYDSLLSLFSSQFLTVLNLKYLKFPIANPVILCPQLKELAISCCKGVKTITVSSLSVEKVEISLCSDLVGVQMMGKNLLCFCFKNGITRSKRCDINLSACESIRHMSLFHIEVSKQLMELVTDSLCIEECDLPENLSFGHPTIKALEMNNNYKQKNMSLLAPNLEHFVYYSSDHCSVDISACGSLKILKLGGVTLTEECVRSTISDLSFLKELAISDCDALEKMELKNDKLEILSLKRCSNLIQAIVDAPKLIKLEYQGNPQVYPMQILSTKCSIVHIKLPKCDVDPDFWFSNLKQFLSCFDHIKDLTITCYKTKDLIFPAKFLKNNASPLRDTKHIKVEALHYPSGQAVKRMVENLLRLVHKPLEFTFSGYGNRKSTLKFEYENKAVKRKRMEKRCCLGVPTKCWRHYALKVDIQGVKENERVSLDKLFFHYNL
ncbi:hypothetical protein K1719_020927 [Acacia pycnantha]|nr:hypothetical protein K1719_020927 [Acacia pycnantha]